MYHCPICAEQASEVRGKECTPCEHALAAINGLSSAAKAKLRHIAKAHPELLGGMNPSVESLLAQARADDDFLPLRTRKRGYERFLD